VDEREPVLVAASRVACDEAGRLLAYLYLPDNTLLNAELIRAGFARVDRGTAATLQAPMEQAEAEARRKRMGLWGDATAGLR
jgi:endonuclease YncB( thermonuclease family)